MKEGQEEVPLRGQLDIAPRAQASSSVDVDTVNSARGSNQRSGGGGNSIAPFLAGSRGTPLSTTAGSGEVLASFEVCGPACQARRAMESLGSSFFGGSSASKALHQCVSSSPAPPPPKLIQVLIDVSRRQNDQTSVGDSVMAQNTWLVSQLQKRLQTAPEEHVIAKVMMVTHDLLAFGANEFAHALAPVAESYFDPDTLIAAVPRATAENLHKSTHEVDMYEHSVRFFISFVHSVLQFQLRHRNECNLLDPESIERLLRERDDGVQFWSPHMRDTVLSCIVLTKFIIASNTSVVTARYNFVFSEILRRYLLDSRQLYRVAAGSFHLMLHSTRDASSTPVEEVRRNMQGMSQFAMLTDKLNEFYDAIRAFPVETVNPPIVSSSVATSFMVDMDHKELQQSLDALRRWENATMPVSELVPARLTAFHPDIHAKMRDRLQRYEAMDAMNVETLEAVLTSSTPTSSVTARQRRSGSAEGSEATLSSVKTTGRHAAIDSCNKDDDDYVQAGTVQLTERTRFRFQVLAEVLGKGGFGIVYKAWDEEEGKHVACKEVKLVADNKAAMQELFQEYSVLATLKHTHIVKVLGFVVHEGNGRIFMEWVPSGSVQSVLQETKKGLREPIVRRYIREALLGLAYLHSRGIVHRDVKPGNMLLNGDGSVKLTDFGTSRTQEHAAHTMQTGTVVGTVPYLAPECVRGTYSAASDVWAIGCTALHMITGKAPWDGEARDNIGLIFKLGSLKEIPHSLLENHDMSDELRRFILSAMTIDRHERPDVVALLEHPFVATSNMPSEL
jgi:hypothetical protein